MGRVSSERLPTFVTAEQGKKGEGPKLEDEAPDDGDAPPSDVRRATTVTDEKLRFGPMTSTDTTPAHMALSTEPFYRVP
jgi:hypothetical protein